MFCSFIPLFVGSKNPTSKFSGSKEVRGRAARKSPIGEG